MYVWIPGLRYARARVCVRARVCELRLSARAAAATIIRWGFRIASGGLASIVVTSIRPMKIHGVSQTYRVVSQPRLPRLAPRSIIPSREFATGSHRISTFLFLQRESRIRVTVKECRRRALSKDQSKGTIRSRFDRRPPLALNKGTPGAYHTMDSHSCRSTMRLFSSFFKQAEPRGTGDRESTGLETAAAR